MRDGTRGDDLTSTERERLIDQYSRMMREHQRDGKKLHFVNLMFNHLPGSQAVRIQQMHSEMERVYATLLTRIVRKPESENGKHLRPVFVGAPDYPVWKHKKIPLSNLKLNDGLHFNGVIAVPRARLCDPRVNATWGRLPESRLEVGLVEHFRLEQARYCNERLGRLHVTPVVEGTMVGYALKTVRIGRVPYDSILVLS
jgi:hypothetical protein